MLERILDFATRQRFLMVLLGVAIAALGLWSFTRLPIDAVPDLTNVQVQVITEAPALPAGGRDAALVPGRGGDERLPDVEQIRSISKFGISVVTIVFHEGTDIYRARQLVGERLQRGRGPPAAGYGTPTLGPIATALGEVFQFQVKATGAEARRHAER